MNANTEYEYPMSDKEHKFWRHINMIKGWLNVVPWLNCPGLPYPSGLEKRHYSPWTMHLHLRYWLTM